MFLGYLLSRIKLKALFFTVLASVPCIYIFQFVVHRHNTEQHVLLWWTPFMGETERIIHCSSKYDCLLTKDRSYLNNSNLQAILFYGSSTEITDLPIPKRNIWALFHEESPRNVALFLSNRTYDLFEISSTFSRYSDFPLTLQYLENLSIITDERYVVSVQEKNHLLNTIAPVLYIQSDCDTPLQRDAYIKELMKYIPVDSYGICLNNKNFPYEIAQLDSLDLYNDKLLHFIAQYKFVIAFENGICEDYITEKLWRPLMVGSVPIYLGSPSVQDWLPNKNSAILVEHFQNPTELAHFIQSVNTNDDLYNAFLEHKFGKMENELLKNMMAQGPFGVETDSEHLITAFECFVCQRIQEGVVKEKRTKSVYNCREPNKGSGWEHYWKSGDCQSKALVESVRNSVKLETDPC